MNIFWLSLTEDMSSGDESRNVGPLGCLFQSGMRWDGYLARWYPDMCPRLEALRSDMLARHVFQSGEWHQDPEQPSIPQFDDRQFFDGSMGACLDFMAAIWATHDSIDDGYCDFAWDGPDREGCRTRKLVSSEDIIACVQEGMLAEFTAELEPANDNDPFEGDFQSMVAREPDSSFEGNAG